MFSRYSEKARSAVLLAREEAARFGAPAFEPEHLLLGLLRSDKPAFDKFLGRETSEETLREQIRGQVAARPAQPPNSDLPASSGTRRILTYAAEEAEQLGHNSRLAPEHLLLGILRERESFAARLLRESGGDLNRMRKWLSSRRDKVPLGPAA